MSESDGVEEAVNAGLRVAMTSAARIAETLVRVRQQHQVRAAQESEQRTQELTARLHAERTAARSAYQGVDDPQWWATAQGEDIASAYREAAAWRDVDPEAGHAEQRIVDEVRSRFDLDVREIETGTVGPKLTEAREDLASRESLEVGEAVVLLAAAERADQDQTAPAAEWDSVERREATAAALTERVKAPDAVDAVMRADTAQAKPASEAVAGLRRSPKARGRSSNGAARQKERQRGLSR